MTHLCAKCGAELFAGQQFCRRCGERTGGLEGEAPTRLLADAPPAPVQGTTVLPPRGTGENFWPPARPTEYHGPLGHASYTTQLPAAQPAPEKKKRGWLVPAILGLLLIVCFAGVAGLVMVARRASFGARFVEKMQPPPPPPPAPGTGVLDETGAVVTGDTTVWTQTFEVSESAVVSLKNLQGDITVEGWDGNGVEVRMTKRGGTAEDRRAARVTLQQTDEMLAFASNETGQIKVSYEVKVPRAALGRVELTSRSGDVKVSGLETPLAVSLVNGDIELDDVRGPAQAKLVNGDIGVVYRGEGREGSQEFKTVNGNVAVRFAEGMAAEVKARVINGEIEVDERLGFQAEKRKPGWSVDAHLGEGGEPLTAESVNGSIKFDK